MKRTTRDDDDYARRLQTNEVYPFFDPTYEVRDLVGNLVHMIHNYLGTLGTTSTSIV